MKIHIVQKGDTLWKIAQIYDVDFVELKNANVHIASPDMIMPGMKIKVPTDDKHVKQEIKSAQHQEKSKDMKYPKAKVQTASDLLSEQSISLGEQSLPSPIQLPKLTITEHKPSEPSQPIHDQKIKKDQSTVKPYQAKLAQMQPTYSMSPPVPQVMPMYSMPLNMCSVCGHMNQPMMPYHPGMEGYPMYMPMQNYYPEIPLQQPYGIPGEVPK